MKRYVSFLLALALAAAFFGCGKKEKAEAPEKPLVGVSLAGGADEATARLAEAFETALTEAGFTPAIQLAEKDTATQSRQIRELSQLGAEVIVVQAVDSTALTESAKLLKDQGIFLIGCDSLIMDTEAVYGCVTYDYLSAGETLAQRLVQEKKLDSAEGVTIEFFMGEPENYNSVLFHKGVMLVLQSYLAEGKLLCKSGQSAYEDAYCLEDVQQAKALCTRRLRGTYTQRKPLQICLAATATIAEGCRQALEKTGYTEKTFPLLVSGPEKDPEALATACAEAVAAALKEEAFPQDATIHNHATDLPVLFLDTKFVNS